MVTFTAMNKVFEWEMSRCGERNKANLRAADLTLQNPVDLAMLSQLLQVHSNACQVDLVLLQGLAAAAIQLDGPLG